MRTVCFSISFDATFGMCCYHSQKKKNIEWKCLAADFSVQCDIIHKYVRAAVHSNSSGALVWNMKSYHIQFTRRRSGFVHIVFFWLFLKWWKKKIRLPWISSTQIFKSSRNVSKCGKHWHLQSSMFDCWFLSLIPTKPVRKTIKQQLKTVASKLILWVININRIYLKPLKELCTHAIKKPLLVCIPQLKSCVAYHFFLFSFNVCFIWYGNMWFAVTCRRHPLGSSSL